MYGPHISYFPLVFLYDIGPFCTFNVGNPINYYSEFTDQLKEQFSKFYDILSS